MNGLVRLETEGSLATVTLNRPAKLNALKAQLAHDLDAALEGIASPPGVQVVVGRGAGRSFCSGLDRDMVADGEVPPGFFALTERSRLRLEDMDKITIAIVHGHCLGGGLQLAIACDVRIAVDDCRLALPAATDGLLPGMAPVRLPRLIGLGPARRLLLMGDAVDAREALRLGLVDHVVASADREPAVRDLVARYLGIPRTAAVAVKQLMARAFEPPVAEIADVGAGLLQSCLAAPETRQAADAWRERRSR